MKKRLVRAWRRRVEWDSGARIVLNCVIPTACRTVTTTESARMRKGNALLGASQLSMETSVILYVARAAEISFVPISATLVI